MNCFCKQTNRNFIFMFFLMMHFSFSMNAQETEKKAQRDSLEKFSKNFHKGYIVWRSTGDTITGLLKWHVFMGNTPEWVDFKMDEDAKKKPYRDDSIVAFGNEKIHWRYFKYGGWAKQIVNGTICMYETEIARMYSTSPVYIFKKGNEKAVFITKDEGEAFTGVLKESQKEDIQDYIFGATDVETKLLKNDFAFKKLKQLIIEYNDWVKAGGK